jgi:ribonuclease-3
MNRTRWAETYLRYSFKDLAILEQALTHRSASRENNERLEFLGDSLLNFTIAAELYRTLDDHSEGDLSRARASLVNREVLSEIGRELAIDTQIILGRGEIRSGGAQRGAALGDALEALIGAVLIDSDYATARKLILRLYARRLEELPEPSVLKDPKTRLQEWLQGRGLALPTYSVDSISGEDHEQEFTVICALEHDAMTSTGQGRSRRQAEQEAASAMLSSLAGERD